MVGRILDYCANNRFLVFLGVGFALLGSYWSIRHIKLDAIPDLSDPQVIVFTEWSGRSPTLVEDQITYPIVSALVSAPHVEDVRGYSMFGMSFVYVLFEEGTDVYWARSRVNEYMGGLAARLPEGVEPVLGPDATGIGWVFQYTLVDRSKQHGLDDLRTFQDFTLRYALGSVPGVAEVASVGGYEKQYQVTVDPAKLRAYGVTLDEVAEKIRDSNADVGGRVLEMSGREYYVRGRGYVTSLADIEKITLKAVGPEGRPVRVVDVGHVRFGPDLRRGLLEWNGEGEAVGGIVVMRYGENALDVIHRVKAKIADLKASMPPGVEIAIAYDRSDLIHRSIDTLKHALIEEAIVVALVIIVFLLHFRSALLPILSLPVSVALAFIPMYLLDIPSTIMSLGGIAIAIGATVDAEIVMIEAAHKKLEHAPPGADRRKLLGEAAREVTPAIFFSLLIIAVSFLPIFTLNGQAGRLFKPLAYTKTFTMLAAAILSITFAPALRDSLIRGRIRPEHQHPVSRFIIALYKPFVFVALRKPKSTILIGLLALVSAIPLARQLGHEFMPALNEGDLLYMPITLPNISIEQAKNQLQHQDRLLRSFPEVGSVFGKIGRAETPTDPAPITMVETTVRLKPRDQWRRQHVERWWSGWGPRWLGKVWPDSRPMTWDELTAEMNEKMKFPGWTNAWTMPIKTRVDMLTTGIRTPIGIKIFGTDLEEIEKLGIAMERLLSPLPGTRSVLYERNLGGLYVDIVPDREKLQRYGLTVGDVERTIEAAIGGTPITMTVEGRNRFSVNVRYPQDLRGDVDALKRVLVAADEDRTVPLGALADIQIAGGPPMVRDEDGLLVGYVYVDIDASRDVGGYVEEAKRVVTGALTLPPGYFLKWTGQYELLEQMVARMKIVIPVTLLIVVVLLFLHFKNLVEVLIVLLSIPFALVGSVWLLWLLDYRLSTAVCVGVIALVGLAAQTGIVMIVYIDAAFERRKRAGKIRDLNDIIWAHMEGTVLRVRPKLMTVGTMLFGLVPLLWATGSGADVMKRLAAPMVGGLLTSAFLTLEIIPVIYTYWRQEQLLHERLVELSPAHRASLRASAAVHGLGWLVLLGLAITAIYVAVPGIVWAVLGGTAALAVLAAATLYLIERPAARRLVWPARTV
jgi:Cu(I)/Ag(I) efflux system membrane protein CusA/SilA